VPAVKTKVVAALFLVELTIFLVLRLAGYFPTMSSRAGLSSEWRSWV
jgi:hypothetical protein